MRFLLGTHQPHWLGLVDVPLMVSHRSLARRRSLPRARGPWALDSGAFSEIAAHGRFETSPSAYVAAVRRYSGEIGHLAWAAPQDWMCEPFMLRRTGLDVPEHQRRTIASVLDLRSIAPELPWTPVLQGWSIRDYGRHVDAYHQAGIDLTAEPLVGLGSVCRRQATSEIDRIVTSLAGQGLRLHGFGVKTAGLGRYGWALESADSLAWSYAARKAGFPAPRLHPPARRPDLRELPPVRPLVAPAGRPPAAWPPPTRPGDRRMTGHHTIVRGGR